jgi:mono/diheme cytochrome c family protein
MHFVTRVKFGVAFVLLMLNVAACGGQATPTTSGPSEAGNIALGSAVYKTACAACHGGDLRGVEGLGNPLLGSELIASNTEQYLATFIKRGRPADDPDNTMGRDMPASGGNPSLTDQDLRDVAAYLKSLN